MIFNYLVVLEGGENGEGKSFTVFSLYCLNLDFFFFFFEGLKSILECGSARWSPCWPRDMSQSPVS